MSLCILVPHNIANARILQIVEAFAVVYRILLHVALTRVAYVYNNYSVYHV